MSRVPIACTLSVDDAAARGVEWRDFVSRHVDAVERPARTVVRLRLGPGDDVLLAAVDLARREKACCAFLVLSMEPLPDATWLVIEAPEEAAGLIDGLLGH
jgi:hypothetical protein